MWNNFEGTILTNNFKVQMSLPLSYLMLLIHTTNNRAIRKVHGEFLAKIQFGRGFFVPP